MTAPAASNSAARAVKSCPSLVQPGVASRG